jgi:hypothetical protein
MFNIETEVRMMKVARLMLTVSLLVMLASCAMEATWAIDGKWQKSGGDEVVQFSRIGTVTLSNGGNALTAHYEFMDPKRIKIDMGSLGAIVLKVSCTRDELSLTNPDGVTTKYRRLF